MLPAGTAASRRPGTEGSQEAGEWERAEHRSGPDHHQELGLYSGCNGVRGSILG